MPCNLPARLIELGCRGNQNPCARPLYELSDMLFRQAAVDGRGDPGELGGEGGGDQLVAVGADERGRAVPGHTEVTQQVGSLMHIAEQLTARATQRLLPARRVG